MHDPNAFLVSLFAQEKDKLNYTHEDFRDDSMYRDFVYFWQAIDNITYREVKSLVFKCQKEIKEITLCERRSEFEAEDKLDRENMEIEARQKDKTASSSSLQLKEKGKDVIETYCNGHSS